MDIEIFGKEIQNAMDFHKQFNKYAQWTYYGHNLDALWDVLKGFSGHLVWYDSKISEQVLGETFHEIIAMFEETRIHSEEKCRKYPQHFTDDDKFTYELR